MGCDAVMIYLFQRQLPAYRIPMLRYLNEELSGDLIVFTSMPNIPRDSVNELGFAVRAVPQKDFMGASFSLQDVTKVVDAGRNTHKVSAVILEASLRNINLFPNLIALKRRKIPVILWGHAGSRRRDMVRSKDPRDLVFKMAIKRADAFITYTENDRYRLERIVGEGTIFTARNTIDATALTKLKDNCERDGKENIKNRLGLSKTYYICYIGRLLKEKRIDMFLRTLRFLQEKGLDIGAIIIGEGPLLTDLKLLGARLGVKHVHWMGRIDSHSESAPFLYASDIQLIPGAVGLSFNHGLAFGLPLVTCVATKDGPFHGPEIDYMVEGSTGAMVDSKNVEDIAETVNEVIQKLPQYKKESQNYFHTKLGVDSFLAGFMDAIHFVDNEVSP